MSNLDIKDIAGLGEIVRHIKDLIIMIIEIRAKTEERRIKNETLRLDNAKKFFQIANEHNLTADQLMTYLNSINSHFSPNIKLTPITQHSDPDKVQAGRPIKIRRS